MPNFETFNIAKDGSTYIHSSINNFNQIYNMNMATFESKLKPLYKEMLDILQLRINHLKSLRIAYASIISPKNPNEALSILNDLYNRSLQEPNSLLGSSLIMKEFATYYKTTKEKDGDIKYLENYRKQATNLLEAFNTYQKIASNLQIQYEGEAMLKLADKRLSKIADDLDYYIKKYTKDNKIELPTGSDITYRNIFKKIRDKKTKNIGPEEQELISKISLDGAIGFTREVAISKMTDKLFEELGKEKGKFRLDVGAYNNILQRADTFETKVKVENKEYFLGFNVKSFSKGYKGKFQARDFSNSLKNKNEELYSYWAYLSKNIAALEIWDSNLFGESFKKNQGTKWENKNQKVDMKLKLDLLKYEALFSQIYNLAGFLDGFLEYTKDGAFVPQPLDKNYEEEKSQSLYKEYIYSVALAMQDQVFWVDELLQRIHDIFLEHIEKVMSSTDSSISTKGFSSSSTFSGENIFSGDKQTLVNIYRQKLKKIKKASGNYSKMAELVSDFDKFKNMKINNIKENKYSIDPYTLNNVRVRRIDINTKQFK